MGRLLMTPESLRSDHDNVRASLLLNKGQKYSGGSGGCATDQVPHGLICESSGERFGDLAAQSLG